MMKNNETLKLYKSAKKRIAHMDSVDGAPISAQPIDLALRTAMTALECGINMRDFSVVADAQVMLAQIEHRYRPADLKGKLFLVDE